MATTRRALDAIGRREGFGINFDPSHLVPQFLDPAAFVDEFADRIHHVHVKDSLRRLDGRRSILGSHLDFGAAERGWDFVSPGHGDVDFEALVRALNRSGYAGPLSIEWEDPGMDREYGARNALAFTRSIDFEPSAVAFDAAFARMQERIAALRLPQDRGTPTKAGSHAQGETLSENEGPGGLTATSAAVSPKIGDPRRRASEVVKRMSRPRGLAKVSPGRPGPWRRSRGGRSREEGSALQAAPRGSDSAVLWRLPLICVFAGIGLGVALLSVDRSSGFHIVSTGVTGSCSEKRAKQLKKVDTMIERYREAVEDFRSRPIASAVRDG